MVGKLFFFWEVPFSGAMLVLGSVNNLYFVKRFFVMLAVLFSDISHLSTGWTTLSAMLDATLILG